MEPITVTGKIAYWAGYLATWALVSAAFLSGLFYLGRAIV